MMFNLERLFHSIFKTTNKTKFLIAYSGGMDSHVLLHSMNNLCEQNPLLKIRAIHVHHGLSVNADSWVKHCTTVCEQLNIELIVKYVNVKSKSKNKHSLESLARTLRYQEISKTIYADECLLTAHHINDQAETVLLQLFRGAGPKGLAAMPKYKNFAPGYFLRPLLEFNRKELHDYAIKNQLQWIEDESNENIGHDRNFVRHQLMPIIQQRWSGMLTTLTRSAEYCAQATDLLEVLAQQDYLLAKGSAPNTLSISHLITLGTNRCNNLIRHWLQKLNLSIPSSIKLQHVLNDVLLCRTDAQPCVHWDGVEIRRYRDDLYAMQPLSTIETEIAIQWNLTADLKLPHNLGILTPQSLKDNGINIDANKNITVRFRHSGDKCKIKNREGSHSLKKIFQERGIPPWKRNRVPLIFQGEELVGIIQ
jgi:tRNA(Ile)-lysidine synthase